MRPVELLDRLDDVGLLVGGEPPRSPPGQC